MSLSSLGSASWALSNESSSFAIDCVDKFGLQTLQDNAARKISVGSHLFIDVVTKTWREGRATGQIGQCIAEIRIARKPFGSYGDVSAPAFVQRLPNGDVLFFYAHAGQDYGREFEGLCHADIKLDNVFRSRGTATRLGDYGLSMKLRTPTIPSSLDAPHLDFGRIPGGLCAATPAMLSKVTTEAMDVRQVGFSVYTGLRGGWRYLPEPINPLYHPEFQHPIFGYATQVEAVARFDFEAAINEDIRDIDPQLADLLISILVPRAQADVPTVEQLLQHPRVAAYAARNQQVLDAERPAFQKAHYAAFLVGNELAAELTVQQGSSSSSSGVAEPAAEQQPTDAAAVTWGREEGCGFNKPHLFRALVEARQVQWQQQQATCLAAAAPADITAHRRTGSGLEGPDTPSAYADSAAGSSCSYTTSHLLQVLLGTQPSTGATAPAASTADTNTSSSSLASMLRTLQGGQDSAPQGGSSPFSPSLASLLQLFESRSGSAPNAATGDINSSSGSLTEQPDRSWANIPALNPPAAAVNTSSNSSNGISSLVEQRERSWDSISVLPARTGFVSTPHHSSGSDGSLLHGRRVGGSASAPMHPTAAINSSRIPRSASWPQQLEGSRAGASTARAVTLLTATPVSGSSSNGGSSGGSSSNGSSGASLGSLPQVSTASAGTVAPAANTNTTSSSSSGSSWGRLRQLVLGSRDSGPTTTTTWCCYGAAAALLAVAAVKAASK